jgi:hypothetical protein
MTTAADPSLSRLPGVVWCELIDLTSEKGPIRQIPGSHRSRAPIPPPSCG